MTKKIISNQTITLKDVEARIIELRNIKVLIDSDVANLYGVETKRINEAVRNNPDKFPPGYLIELDKFEWDKLRSKFSSSIKGGKNKLPIAFTEKGLYMLATILKSSRATATTLSIIDTFCKVREIENTIKLLPSLKDDSSKHKQLIHRTGEILSELIQPVELEASESESSIEVNLALVRFKHIVKKVKK